MVQENVEGNGLRSGDLWCEKCSLINKPCHFGRLEKWANPGQNIREKL